MNSNTVVNALQAVNDAPQVLNSPTVLTLFGAPSVLSVPSTQAQAELDASLAGISLPAKQLWYADGRPFRINAFGLIKPLQASKTYTINLYYGNGLAVSNPGGTGTTIVAALAGAVNAAVPFDTNWNLDVTCQWDSASQTLNCVLEATSYVNKTVATASTLVQIANVAPGALQFVIGAYSNDSGAGQAVPFQIQLTEFSAELL